MKKIFLTIITLTLLPIMACALKNEFDGTNNNGSSYNTMVSEPVVLNLTPQSQEPKQNEAPFGYESLKYEKLNMIHKFRHLEEEQNLVFSAKGYTDAVEFIYIIPTNSKGSKDILDNPPIVHVLVYHDIGKDKEYCGAIIEQDIKDKDTDEYKGTLRYEMRLPDETAQLIIDLVTNHSKFKNKTLVNIKETTNPHLTAAKIDK